MPLHLLRLQSRRLDKEKMYVVCGDSVRTGALAAFLLAVRGFDACYLESPLPGVTTGNDTERTLAANDDAISEIDLMSEQKVRESVEASAGDGTAIDTEAGNGSGAPRSETVADDGRVAREEFAETTTGEELADLIDELYRQREEFGEAGDVGAAAQRETPPRSAQPAVSPAVEAATVLPPAAGAAADIVPGTGAREIVGEILRDVEDNLSGYLAQFIETQRGALEQRVEQRLAALERAALECVHEKERALQARFEQALADKEKSLSEAYDRLTSLANRISHQKAEIQQARKTLENMLRTASRVHREVYRVGNALVDQFDHLDDFADDMKLQ